MSDLDPERPPRGGRLLTGLFWAGVGLAPLAGLILLLGGGSGSMKAAAFLAVLAVVLIGLSIALRPDATAVRAEVEETLLDEIEMLREDVRDDIATAARATHQAFDERVQILQQTVDALRAEVAAVRAAGPLAGAPAPHVSVPAQPVMATAAVPVPPPAAGPGGDTYVPAGEERHHPPAAGRAHVPTGVVRHTETVHHVTTRSTFVDRPGEEDRYPGHHAEPASAPPDWAARSPQPPAAAPAGEESWTDRMLRERYGRPAGQPDRSEGAGEHERERRGGGRRRRWDGDGPDPAHKPDQSGPADVQSGWSLHTEDRAAELRMGERRAAMRTSESGTEMRIEDRWAAVRREWDPDAGSGSHRPARDAGSGSHRPARDAGSGSHRPARDAGDAPGDGRWGSSGRGGDAWEPDTSPADRWEWDRDGPAAGQRAGGGPAHRERRELPALPASEDVPSWNADWEEPRGRRHRTDDERDYRAGRRLDFELTDERWR
jgi:hypothetical protein